MLGVSTGNRPIILRRLLLLLLGLLGWLVEFGNLFRARTAVRSLLVGSRMLLIRLRMLFIIGLAWHLLRLSIRFLVVRPLTVRFLSIGSFAVGPLAVMLPSLALLSFALSTARLTAGLLWLFFLFDLDLINKRLFLLTVKLASSFD